MGVCAAESQEKDTWLWQSSQKSFQGHLEAPGGSSSLESKNVAEAGRELWDLILFPCLEPKCWWR